MIDDEEMERQFAILDQGNDLLNNAYRLLNDGQKRLMASVVSLCGLVIALILRQWWLLGLASIAWVVFVGWWWRDLQAVQAVLRQHRALLQYFSVHGTDGKES